MKKIEWKKILAGVLALLMLVSLSDGVLTGKVSAAKNSSEIEAQLNELKKEKQGIDAEIKKLEGQISENMDEMKAIVAQKDVIDQEVALLYGQIDNINDQVASYNLLIADKQTELEDAQAHLDALNAKYKERIRAMEEGGTVSYWAVLFKANSFSDLLDRVRMIEEIAAADSRRLQELRDAAAVVRDAKEGLETQKREAEATKAELKQTQTALEEKRAKADELLSDLIAKGDEFTLWMEEKEDEQAKLSEDIAKKKSEWDQAKYEEMMATSVPPTTPPSSSGGSSGGSGGGNTGGVTGHLGGSGVAGTARVVNGITWLTPVSFTMFTSAYGWRIHPIYGTRKWHDGVDLAAPAGTPIIATRSGQVTIASYQAGGAGNYVTIEHGDGYRTIYMHMTRYIVKVGQSVAAGEVIGYVGSTGASTGPHLHFGVSYNGVSQNPAMFIAI